MSEKAINVLIAEAGDKVTDLDAYSNASEQMVRIVVEKYPNAVITLLSNYLKTESEAPDIRDRIMTLMDGIRAYDLILIYVPEPHMLNAILIWNSCRHGVPAIVISQCDDCILFPKPPYHVRDFAGLVDSLEREDFTAL